MGIYITQDDLALAMNDAALKAIFDDDNDGFLDGRAIEAVIRRAEVTVNSYLRPVYQHPFDIEATDIPELIKAATIDFAYVYALERHSEYAKGYGSKQRTERFDRAVQTMKNIQGAVQEIYDVGVNAETPPTTTGGILYDDGPRTMIRGLDGSDNGFGF